MTNPSSETSSATTLIRLVGECPIKIWGLDSLERMQRVAKRFGFTDVAYANVKAEDRWQNEGGALHEPAWSTPRRVLLVRSDVLLEDRLIKKLLERGPLVLATEINGKLQAVAARSDDNYPAAIAALADGASLDDLPPGLPVARPDAPELCYDDVLRKRAVPFVLPLNHMTQSAVEWRMFGASYKGATDFVTKWLWPVPAFHFTRLCAKLGLSPNMVTAVSGLFVLLAFAAFWYGQFGLGIACAWIMTFLDTVDGKLARTTVTSSKWGNVFDHGIDMVHPPFWYWAWWHGLGEAGLANTSHEVALWIILAGYVLGRLIEGAFIAGFKFEMHIWRPFDYWLRAFTARRNPNMFILMIATIFAMPDVGFLVVALWTIVCLLAHGIRLAQAYALKANNVDVRSFLSATH
jgi:phosphatidylglycerophosphate synthase